MHHSQWSCGSSIFRLCMLRVSNSTIKCQYLNLELLTPCTGTFLQLTTQVRPQGRRWFSSTSQLAPQCTLMANATRVLLLTSMPKSLPTLFVLQRRWRSSESGRLNPSRRKTWCWSLIDACKSRISMQLINTLAFPLLFTCIKRVVYIVLHHHLLASFPAQSIHLGEWNYREPNRSTVFSWRKYIGINRLWVS